MNFREYFHKRLLVDACSNGRTINEIEIYCDMIFLGLYAFTSNKFSRVMIKPFQNKKVNIVGKNTEFFKKEELKELIRNEINSSKVEVDMINATIICSEINNNHEINEENDLMCLELMNQYIENFKYKEEKINIENTIKKCYSLMNNEYYKRLKEGDLIEVKFLFSDLKEK